MDKLIEASRQSGGEGPKRTFITNLFEGINTVVFRKPDFAISAIRSKENEEIALN